VFRYASWLYAGTAMKPKIANSIKIFLATIQYPHLHGMDIFLEMNEISKILEVCSTGLGYEKEFPSGGLFLDLGAIAVKKQLPRNILFTG
jgi:hypothetical protein